MRIRDVAMALMVLMTGREGMAACDVNEISTVGNDDLGLQHSLRNEADVRAPKFPDHWAPKCTVSFATNIAPTSKESCKQEDVLMFARLHGAADSQIPGKLQVFYRPNGEEVVSLTPYKKVSGTKAEIA